VAFQEVPLDGRPEDTRCRLDPLVDRVIGPRRFKGTGRAACKLAALRSLCTAKADEPEHRDYGTGGFTLQTKVGQKDHFSC
jgi:hypothetical protein